MEPNLGRADRVARAVIGAGLLAIGTAVGGLAWWGIVLDALGVLLLFSAAKGFCHVRKVVVDLVAARRG